MYGWIGKNFYNHRVILTSTIEYDNFQRLRKFRLSEFFFYVILKLSIVRREKRMKKSKNLKGKIGAVMLSLVLALTMVVTPSMFTTKSVSADEENTENVKSQKIFDNWTMAAQIADKTTNYFDADGTPDLQTAVFYTELQYGIKPNTNEEIKAEDFCKKVKDNFTGIKSFTEADLAKINPLGMYTYDQENHKIIIPGGGAGSGLICTFIGQNEVNFGNVKYGKWKDLAVPSEEPYYIALDVKDNGQIKAYREIKSEDVSVDVDIYRYQYSDDEEEPVKVSYLKDYNKEWLLTLVLIYLVLMVVPQLLFLSKMAKKIIYLTKTILGISL